MTDPIPFGSVRDYVEQWRRNRRCCALIDRQFRDWQITLVFYTALHAINAAAAHLGEKPCDHRSRGDLVRTNEAFAPVRKQYLRLYRLSRFTRYDPNPDDWLPQEYLDVQAVVDRELNPIESQIQMLLGRNLNLSPITMQR